MSKVGTYQVMEHGDEVHGDEGGHKMMMIKLNLERKRKTKTEKIKAKVYDGFLFLHSRHHRGCK